ncbi:Protein CBR-CYP-35D1 [Caenorhabditis briggsae]|uniref:Protein CBR-CYP-35D1 n=1 Tax=Caenorhabditis briggsae TaxID=6238 RepID=A8Y357_CAEBR|nr:Protein CBR-CYP-35D1 [Caenorhabditis briggsae]CAP39326.1 Protein CBR-CYP-35D1 [Caenorhabditis briggsae]
MILLLSFCLLLIFWIISNFRKGSNLPPGPTPLPLIGNIHQLIYLIWKLNGIVPTLDFYRKKYGNAYTIWLGPMPTVNITDYEMAHEIFVKNGKKCQDRQLAPVLEHISGGHGILAANGENWAEMRRFTLLSFRKMGVGSGLMEKKIMAELDGRCSELDAEIDKNGKVTVPVDFFDLTVGSVINSLLVGKRFDENSKDEFLKIKKMFDDSSETFNLFDLNVPVWFLKWVLPWRFRITWDARQNILSHVGKEAVERFQKLKDGTYDLDSEEPKDLVDCFLAKMRSENEKGQDGHPGYNMDALKLVLHDLWLAGQGTTATSLYVGFLKLVTHPSVILKIQKELLKITQGSRDLTLQDRPNTPYLNATIAEIQRFTSVLNVNFWRINDELISFRGFQVPAGTMMTAQIGALHVNEQLFENPDEFDPERFLRNEKLLQQLIPFGIGKRSCVGEQLARSELYLVLGNLLLRYDIRAHGALPTNMDVFPYSSAKLPDTSGKFEFRKIQKT